MILHDLKHNEARIQSVLNAICGIRIDSVELDRVDVNELLELPPENLRLWLENISRRFRLVWDEIKPEDVDKANISADEFNKQYLCNWKPLVISDENRHAINKKFNETIQKRLSQAGNSPIVIIQSRLHEEDDPGFTLD